MYKQYIQRRVNIHIDKGQLICNIDARLLRKAFIYFDDSQFTEEALAQYLNISYENTNNSIFQLKEKGLIETVEKRDLLEITTLGNRIKNASSMPPITRKKAKQILEELIKRAVEINTYGNYLYKINKITVFGSYLSELERINDIDVKVEIERCIDYSERYESYIRDAKLNGKRFYSFIEKLTWPEIEIYRTLKKRSHYLSFSGDDEEFVKKYKYEVIFHKN